MSHSKWKDWERIPAIPLDLSPGSLPDHCPPAEALAQPRQSCSPELGDSSLWLGGVREEPCPAERQLWPGGCPGRLQGGSGPRGEPSTWRTKGTLDRRPTGPAGHPFLLSLIFPVPLQLRLNHHKFRAITQVTVYGPAGQSSSPGQCNGVTARAQVSWSWETEPSSPAHQPVCVGRCLTSLGLHFLTPEKALSEPPAGLVVGTEPQGSLSISVHGVVGT